MKICKAGVFHRASAGAGEEKLAFLYFSRETGQTWKPDAAPGVNEDGAAMWLPNNVLVELLMTDEVCPILCALHDLLPVCFILHSHLVESLQTTDCLCDAADAAVVPLQLWPFFSCRAKSAWQCIIALRLVLQACAWDLPSMHPSSQMLTSEDKLQERLQALEPTDICLGSCNV